MSNLPSPDADGIIASLLAGSDPTDANSFCKKRTYTSEEYLWLCVLWFAVEDYKQNLRNSSGKIFCEVFDWFFNEPEPDYMGSFENICTNLDISANAVRALLIKYAKENRNGTKKKGLEFGVQVVALASMCVPRSLVIEE